MKTQRKPQAISLGNARTITKTEFPGEILEIENPVLARKL